MPGNDKLIPVLRGGRDLHEAGLLSDGVGLVFPSRRGKALSDMTLSKLVKDRLENRQIDSFRSSVLDVFDLDAAEKLTYSWLLDDLRQVHWIR